jgi:hypothetical protein
MQTSNPPSKLIRINARNRSSGIMASSLAVVVMPIDSMLVSAAVILMFLMFAGVLMWGEVHGRPERRKPVPLARKRGKKVSENYIALRP